MEPTAEDIEYGQKYINGEMTPDEIVQHFLAPYLNEMAPNEETPDGADVN